MYEEDFKEDILKYKKLKFQIDSARAERNTEEIIYNHLTLFFSRYYDKGDFISKRRFGKNEKYMVPYNGEEIHFYWANHDQYYIKSSETFRKYAFKAPSLTYDLVVSFKLTDASTEQGNIKGAENRYFVLSEKAPELNGNELNVFFEYRPLNEKEKKEISPQKKQDKLNEKAAGVLESKLRKEPATAALWIAENEQTLLLRKLHHYTRKNNYDFFIHKNLKGFLQRELDYYIKSELVNVNDLYVLETEEHFENVRHNFKTIKVFKNIADIIIDFLSQIEEFQKKLWEKKKFVLNTEWVITIDKLVEWLGETSAEPFLEETLKNETQRQEWKALFGEENIPSDEKVSSLKHDLYSWKKLPIDTVHFDGDFKWRLLNALSEEIDLEEKTDGLVIHSDNFHGMKIIKEKFYGQIASIYIDPPYNTGDDGFIYKDSYKSSSWLTMLNPLISMSKESLSENGSFFVSCDEHEEEYLGPVISSVFSNSNKVEKISWNKRVPKNDKGIGNIHEYIFVFSKNSECRKERNLFYLMRKEFLDEIYELVKKAKNAGKNIEQTQAMLKRFYRKHELDRGITLYCELDENYEIWGKINLSWPNPKTEGPRYEVINPVTTKATPVPKNGWRWIEETFRNAENEGGLHRLPDGSLMKGRIWYSTSEKVQPSSIKYLREVESFLLRSIISLKSDGSLVLESLNLKEKVNYPKPVKLIETIFYACGINSGFFLDFFSGSGTSFHALQCLNNQDGKRRKYILMEQGSYVETVIIPRIKKIAYTFDWKEGKPKNGNMNGLGIFFKYQRLEQYEEALENIAFDKDEATLQKTLALEDYIPKYFLEFETRDSQTFVNIEAMFDPWNYRLKVWDGFNYDTEQAVDILETFNYLIGLHMQKCITKEINGKRYQFVYGNDNSNKRILAAWRNIKNWNLKDYEIDSRVLKDELASFNYDLLYINGQAHFEGYIPIEEVFKNRMAP